MLLPYHSKPANRSKHCAGQIRRQLLHDDKTPALPLDVAVPLIYNLVLGFTFSTFHAFLDV